MALKPVNDMTLGTLLKAVAQQIKGDIVVRDRVVLIVEESEAKKLKK